MENVLIVDTKRIEACGFHATDRPFNFLLVDDQLVIGALAFHSDLYVTWKLRQEPLDDLLREKAKAIRSDSSWSEIVIAAAGLIGKRGNVTGWESTGFGVKTPEGMRPQIEQEIKRLFDVGLLTARRAV